MTPALPHALRLAGQAVSRAANTLHLPLRHEGRLLTEVLALTDSDVWNAPPSAAPRQPVVLVGGMASTPTTQLPMRRWLERAGHPVTAAPVRLGLACGEETSCAVLATLEASAEQHGRPAVLIAHSRGGQYARVATVRRPELVERLVTLGSPLIHVLGVHRLLQVECVLIGLAGTVGVPGLFGAGCLWGECCRQMRAELAGPFPDVPFLSVYSRADQVVRWTSCLDPAARRAEVTSSHGGLLVNTEVYASLRRELDETLPRLRRPASAVFAAAKHPTQGHTQAPRSIAA